VGNFDDIPSVGGVATVGAFDDIPQRSIKTDLKRAFEMGVLEDPVFQQKARAAQELAPVVFPGFQPTINAVTAMQEGRFKEALPSAVRGLPFGKLLTQGEITSRPLEERAPRDIITNVAKAINPQFQEPQGLPAQIGLDVLGSTLALAPTAGVRGIMQAGKRVDALRAAHTLKNLSARKTRLAGRQAQQALARQVAREPLALPWGREGVIVTEQSKKNLLEALARQPKALLPGTREGVIVTPEVSQQIGQRTRQAIAQQPKQLSAPLSSELEAQRVQELAGRIGQAVEQGVTKQPPPPRQLIPTQREVALKRAGLDPEVLAKTPTRPPILEGPEPGQPKGLEIPFRGSVRSSKVLGEKGELRIGKSFEGLSEQELAREVQRLKASGGKGVIPRVDPTKATIRKDKFSPEQRPIIEGIEETFDLSSKTRGRVSIKEINARAKSGKITVEELAKLPEGTALPAEELQRARGLTQEAIGTADDAIGKFLKSPADEISLADAVAATKTAVETLTSTRAAMAEAGRSLRVLRESVLNRVRLPSDAKQALENLNKDQFIEFATKFRKAIEQGEVEAAQGLLKQQVNRPWWQKAVDLSNALLLTNPQTDIANTVGNTIANVVMTTEKVAIAGVDKIRSILTKTPRERFLGEAAKEGFATIEGVKAGAKDFIDVMLGKINETGKIAEISASTLPKKGIDKLSDFIFRRLGAADVFFKTVKRNQSVNAQAYRIAKQENLKGIEFATKIKQLRDKPTRAMLDEANNAALEATFQEPLGAFTKKLNAIRQFAPVRVIFPFFRTLINLAKFPARRSPLALTPGTRSLRQIRGLEGPGIQSEAIGKAMLGTIATIPVATMASQGFITGAGPENKNKKNLLRAQGWQPFAIRVGDKYVQYRRGEPLSTFMATIATMVERTNDGEEPSPERVGEAISAAAEFVSDQTFWRGLRELIDASRGRNPRFLTNLISGRVTPPGLAFVSRTMDPEFKDPEGLKETLKSRIPGVSKSIRPRLDTFGEPIRKKGILNRVSPFPVTKFEEDPVAQEMIRLDVGIAQQGRRLRTIPLSKDERFDINRIAGPIAKDVLDVVVNNQQYKKAPDEVKAKVLNKIIRKSKSGAQRVVLLEIAKRELAA